MGSSQLEEKIDTGCTLPTTSPDILKMALAPSVPPCPKMTNEEELEDERLERLPLERKREEHLQELDQLQPKMESMSLDETTSHQFVVDSRDFRRRQTTPMEALELQQKSPWTQGKTGHPDAFGYLSLSA